MIFNRWEITKYLNEVEFTADKTNNFAQMEFNFYFEDINFAMIYFMDGKRPYKKDRINIYYKGDVTFTKTRTDINTSSNTSVEIKPPSPTARPGSYFLRIERASMVSQE